MKLSAPPPPPPEPPEPPAPNPEPNRDGNPADPVAAASGRDGGSSGTPTSLQPPAPAAEPSAAPAPTTKEPPKPATWPAWFAGVDAAQVVLTLALAFLAASFAARNSDLWLHLAAGKRLVAGEYSLGSDPFSYTAADRPWVNHSWLFDLGLYLLYGGTGITVVVLKALAVAVAAALLMAIRRPGFPLWPWAACAALAVVASAPRLTLAPPAGSFLLMAVTLFVLFRLPARPGSWRIPVAIGVTFWVWSNVDGWFILGPAALGLLLLGELAQQRYFGPAAEGEKKAADPAPAQPPAGSLGLPAANQIAPTSPEAAAAPPGEPALLADPAGPQPEPLGPVPDVVTLSRALLVGVLACMLNPHHVRVWQIPFELVGAAAASSDAQLVQGALLSPTDGQYARRPEFGNNLNGLAYALLLVGGGVVMGFGVGRLRVSHLALWLGFAALSLLSVYAIPFFAVVAVPMVAAQLNALSARARLGFRTERRTRVLLVGSGGGRVLCLLGLLLGCVSAWPGWLHPPQSNWWEPAGNPGSARRVGWAVEPDAEMVRAATRFNDWREEGSLPADARGLITSAELANYCAWYAPREKVFLNTRYNHHRAELPDFVQVRRSLGLVGQREEPPSPREAAGVLARHKAEYLVVHEQYPYPNRVRGLTAAFRVWAEWEHWSPWYVDGRTWAFGWREGNSGGPASFAALKIDPAREAFGPNVGRLPAGRADPVPPPREWFDDFVRPARSASPDVSEALGWLDYKAARAQLRQGAAGVFGQLALMGVPGPGGAWQAVVAEELTRRGVIPPPGPPPEGSAEYGAPRALAVLALRAARRAVAANPDHPDGYYALARALEDRDLPIPEGERMIAVVTAYRRCLARMPAPADWRPNVYAASPTAVAETLTRLYLNPTQNNVFRGLLVDAYPVRDLVGEMILARGNQPAGRVPLVILQTQSLPPDVRVVGGPFLLPLDLARETMRLANEYAEVEIRGGEAEQRKQVLDQYRNLLRALEDRVRVANDAYLRDTRSQPKPAARYHLARQHGLVGEAVGVLKGLKGDEFAKEFGPGAFDVALQLICLELAVGRLEDAAADIPPVADAMDKAAQAANPDPRLPGLRQVLRYVEYHTAVLEGDYPAAAAHLEALEGGGIGLTSILDQLTKQKFDPRPFHALGVAWPAVPILGVPVFGSDSTLGMLALYWGGTLHYHGYEVVQELLANKLEQDSRFFFRLGFFALIEGDMATARARFGQAYRQAPPGWGVENRNHIDARDYLRLMDEAEKRAARK